MILIGSTVEIVRTTISSLFGIFALGAGFMGYLTRNLNWPVRILLMVSGIAMVDPGMVTDIIGVALILAVVVYLLISGKKMADSKTKT